MASGGQAIVEVAVRYPMCTTVFSTARKPGSASSPVGDFRRMNGYPVPDQWPIPWMWSGRGKNTQPAPHDLLHYGKERGRPRVKYGRLLPRDYWRRPSSFTCSSASAGCDARRVRLNATLIGSPASRARLLRAASNAVDARGDACPTGCAGREATSVGEAHVVRQFPISVKTTNPG